MFKKLHFSLDISNFMALKHVFCHRLSAVMLSYYMTPTDVQGIKHIDIRPGHT